MDYELKKNHHYVVEWIDPLHLVSGENLEEVKERNSTFGKFLGKIEGHIYVALNDEESNVKKIPEECLMHALEVTESSNLGLVMNLLLFLAVCTSLWFSFNPPQYAVEYILDTLISNETIIIEDYGTSH